MERNGKKYHISLRF